MKAQSPGVEGDPRALFETLNRINDGIVAFDAEMNYTFVNNRGAEMLGRKPEELIGKNYFKEYPEARETPFANAYVKALETQRPVVFEDYYQPWDRWFENRLYPSKEGLTIFFTEVTDRKKAEEELRRVKELYQDLVETSQDLIWQCDSEGRFTYLNRAWEETHGYAIEEMIGRRFADFQPPAYAERDTEEFSRLMGGNTVRNFETVHRRKDGKDIHLVFNAKFYRDSNGKVSGTMGTAYDITDRKQAEEGLRRSENKWRTLVGTIPDYVALCDVDGRYQFLNHYAKGYSAGDVVGKHYSAFLPESSRVLYDQAFERIRRKEGTQFIEYEAPGNRGEQRMYDSYIVPLFEEDRITNIMVIARDITERKRQEKLVALESQVLAMVAQQEPLAQILERIVLNIESLSKETIASILLLDPDGLHVHYGASPHLPDVYNRAIEGAPIGPVAGSCGTAAYRKEPVIVTDIEADPLWENYRDLIRPHGLRACWSTPIISKGGTVLGTFALYYKEPRSPKAEDFALIEFTTHLALIVLENKRAAEELVESERKYRDLFEHAHDMIHVVNSDGIIIDANNAELKTLGYSRIELIGKSFFEIIHADYRERSRTTFARVRAEHKEILYETTLVARDGREIPVEVSVVPKAIRGRFISAQATLRDITERKRAVEELKAHRQLLETVVNYIPAAVSLLRGSDLRVQLVNPAYQAIAPGKEMIGKTWDELWAETGQNFTAICRRVLDTGETFNVVDELNMIHRTPEGPIEKAYFSWSLHRVRLPGNEGWGLLGTAWETTNRKVAEEEIKESREQLRALAGHLQTVIEDERARIAREIHDDIGQVLTATKMDLSLLKKRIEDVKDGRLKKALKEELESLINLLNNGVLSIRKVIRDLRPEVLETMGLLAGIQWQAEEFEKRAKVTVMLSLPREEPQLDKQWTVAIFRVVQEALTNIARHAGASRVRIHLEAMGNGLKLLIEDNGVGVTGDPFAKSGSFGLLAMRERVVALGGTLSLRGVCGEGTSLEAILPRKQV